jgi:hypothetical protein
MGFVEYVLLRQHMRNEINDEHVKVDNLARSVEI